MSAAGSARHSWAMTTIQNPRTAAAEVARTPILPTGPDETVTGFGVMGLPFASGHYLALRDFPAASFLPDSVPGYRSVWHRDPDGAWTFYATTPAEHSCARYFSTATANDAVVCPVEVTWTGDYTLVVDIPDVLHWTIELRHTAATRLLTADRVTPSGRHLDEPGRTRRHRPIRRHPAGRRTGPARGHHAQRPDLPDRAQAHVGGPIVACAMLHGRDLGNVAPLPDQARLGDFRAPQRGLAVVGQGRFDAFDPTRHRTAADLACPPSR